MSKPKKLIKSILGTLLVVIALLSAVIALVQMRRSPFADFPCDDGVNLSPNDLVKPGVRIAYCIDFIGRYVVSGAGIYAQGISDQDKLTLDSENEEGFNPIVMRRENQILNINGRTLNTGQSYSSWSWSVSSNSWLPYVNHRTIQNAGLDDSFGALLVTGEVYEDWLPNPIGFILLIAGVLFIYK